jgi:hypothetical protein
MLAVSDWPTPVLTTQKISDEKVVQISKAAEVSPVHLRPAQEEQAENRNRRSLFTQSSHLSAVNFARICTGVAEFIASLWTISNGKVKVPRIAAPKDDDSVCHSNKWQLEKLNPIIEKFITIKESGLRVSLLHMLKNLFRH